MTSLSVVAAGVRLPVADDLTELGEYLTKGAMLDGEVRWFEAPHTDLRPLPARVGVCRDPDGTASRRLPREARLAATVAARALGPDRDAGTGTVWASTTAGMAEYGQVCVEASTLEPGLASPLTGPQAAYNGPAAAISISLRLTGPQLTLIGGIEAGASAVVEAGRLVHEGQCTSVLVGASASVDRWRLADAEPGLIPAEGAACLLLTGGGGSGPAIRPLRRSRLRPAQVDSYVRGCLADLDRPPALVVTAATLPWQVHIERALRNVPCWYSDQMAGCLGAASGLQAVTAAVAAVWHGVPASALILAIGGTGNAVALEVVSKERDGSV